MPPGAVFSCLYRHAYRTEEQGRRVSANGQLAACSSVVEGLLTCLEVGHAALKQNSEKLL